MQQVDRFIVRVLLDKIESFVECADLQMQRLLQANTALRIDVNRDLKSGKRRSSSPSHRTTLFTPLFWDIQCYLVAWGNVRDGVRELRDHLQKVKENHPVLPVIEKHYPLLEHYANGRNHVEHFFERFIDGLKGTPKWKRTQHFGDELNAGEPFGTRGDYGNWSNGFFTFQGEKFDVRETSLYKLYEIFNEIADPLLPECLERLQEEILLGRRRRDALEGTQPGEAPDVGADA